VTSALLSAGVLLSAIIVFTCVLINCVCRPLEHQNMGAEKLHQAMSDTLANEEAAPLFDQVCVILCVMCGSVCVGAGVCV